eukprot:TRINITY_DN141159_c0_g1_i1.p1 TRINITY_DN141159_c0_g1~~TRINITY_DN141159_c0_g1_i1.p1  ORF type:complete len:431 (-),score=47.55 TRINITY_DN141159_c0_g1_i1:128-1270(-)
MLSVLLYIFYLVVIIGVIILDIKTILVGMACAVVMIAAIFLQGHMLFDSPCMLRNVADQEEFQKKLASAVPHIELIAQAIEHFIDIRVQRRTRVLATESAEFAFKSWENVTEFPLEFPKDLICDSDEEGDTQQEKKYVRVLIKPIILYNEDGTNQKYKEIRDSLMSKISEIGTNRKFVPCEEFLGMNKSFLVKLTKEKTPCWLSYGWYIAFCAIGLPYVYYENFLKPIYYKSKISYMKNVSLYERLMYKVKSPQEKIEGKQKASNVEEVVTKEVILDNKEKHDNVGRVEEAILENNEKANNMGKVELMVEDKRKTSNPEKIMAKDIILENNEKPDKVDKIAAKEIILEDKEVSLSIPANFFVESNKEQSVIFSNAQNISL